MIWFIENLPGEDDSLYTMMEDLGVPLEPQDSCRDPLPWCRRFSRYRVWIKGQDTSAHPN